MNDISVTPITKSVVTLYGLGSFQIKHHVSYMKNIPMKKTKRSIYNTWKPANSDTTSLYVDPSYIGSLSFESTDNNGKRTSVYITPNKFHQIQNMFNVAYSWITSKDYEKLYTHNSNGMVTGVGNIPIHIPIVSLLNGVTISVIPTVIKDFDDVKYEGIAIKSSSGTIVLLTGYEYINMVLQLNSYLNNTYASNMSVMNNAMLYMITQKLGLHI